MLCLKVWFVFQLSLKGPPGPLGLTGRPGPQVHPSDLYLICFHTHVFLQLHNMFATQNLLSSSLSLGVLKLIVKSLQGGKNEK